MSVRVPERPDRIVSMAPSITEILFAVGAGDQVVGVTDYCLYPPEARERTSCGGYLNPNFEVLLGLEPDIVLFQGEHDALRDFCEQRSIAHRNFVMEGVEGILDDIAAIGATTGHAEEGARLAAAMRADFDALRRTASAPAERPRTLLVLTRSAGSLDRVFSAGPGAFLDELLTLAGGANVLADVPMLYPQVGLESLLERAPETILEIQPAARFTPEQRAALVADWNELPQLPAVAAGRIRVLEQDYLMIPGPRMAAAVVALRRALDPASPIPELRTVGAEAHASEAVATPTP